VSYVSVTPQQLQALQLVRCHTPRLVCPLLTILQTQTATLPLKMSVLLAAPESTAAAYVYFCMHTSVLVAEAA
jgi:hypothetical protein